MGLKKAIAGTILAGASALTLTFDHASFDARETFTKGHKEINIHLSLKEGNKKYDYFEANVPVEQAMISSGLALLAGGVIGAACPLITIRRRRKHPAPRKS